MPQRSLRGRLLSLWNANRSVQWPHDNGGTYCVAFPRVTTSAIRHRRAKQRAHCSTPLGYGAFLDSLDEFASLAPGLYEMKISNPTSDPDCRKPQYSVAFEERRVEDLAFNNPRTAFERVRQLSQANETLYRKFASPLVQAMATPWSTEALRWLHPMRSNRYLLPKKSSPWMHFIARLTNGVRTKRMSVSPDHPMRAAEPAFSKQTEEAIEIARETRGSVEEQLFHRLYS